VDLPEEAHNRLIDFLGLSDCIEETE
jgi:hypothetical protein